MAAKDDGYIRFRCRGCGKRLKISETVEGGNVIPCPKCGAPVNVPLANIEAIAQGTDMEETGQPGRINVDPELLRKRLRGDDEEGQGAAAMGGPPTLRQAPWSAGGAFGRITELDQLAAALLKMNEEVMRQVQRVFREQDLGPEGRAEQVKDAAEQRREDIRQLLERHLGPLRQKVRRMDAQHQRLSRAEWDELDRLKAAAEALGLYARHVLGIQV